MGDSPSFAIASASSSVRGARRRLRRIAWRPLFCFLLLPGLAVAGRLEGSEDPAARRLFQEGQRRLQAGDPGGALTELGLLIQQFPADVLASKAMLQTVELRRAQQDEVGVEAALKKLLTDYARTPEAAAGFVVQGEMAIEKARSAADYEEARSIFRRVALLFGSDSYRVLDARVLARLRSAEIDLQLGDRQGALSELLAALEDEPAGPHRGRIKLLYGRTLLADTAEAPAALQVLQELAEESAGKTSNAEERGAAKRLIALAHRQVIRPQAGQPQWSRVARYPFSGLTLREPDGVAAADDGRMVVVDRRAGLVVLLAESGEVLAQKANEDAERPAFSAGAAGSPYVLSGAQIELPFDGQSVGFLQPRTGKEAPLKGMFAAVRSAFGDWYILSKNYDGLLNYQTPRLGQELLAGQRFDFADIELDPFGRIYLLDAASKRVLRLGADRRTLETVAQSTWKKATALAIDALGNFYVLDRGNRRVEIFDAGGKLRGAAGPLLGSGIELKDPQDLAVDGSGRLAITDRKLPFVVVLE